LEFFPEFFNMRRKVSKREEKDRVHHMVQLPSQVVGPTLALLFTESPSRRKTYAQFFTYISEAVAEAKVLFFSERGKITAAPWLHQGEINIVITTSTPLVWGEESSSPSTTTSPSPSSSPPRLMSPHSQFV
jgi:hypothetical protein